MTTVSVPATTVLTNNGWIDSGITLGVCTALTVVATGTWQFASGGGNTCAADGSVAFPTPTPGIAFAGLITYLAQDGTVPIDQPETGNPGPTSGIYAANANVANVCTTTYNAATIAAGNPVGSAPWRVWYRIADTVRTDNSGSISVNTTIAADGTVPAAPVISSATFSMDPNACTISVVLVWGAVSGVTSYSVYRNGVLLQNLIDPATLTYTDTTTTQGVTYSYVVRALNACGSSDSSPASVTPDTGMVSAPTVCQPCCETRAIVSWQVVLALSLSGHPAATYYQLWRQVNGGGYNYLRTFYANDTLRYLDVDVVVGGTYDYQVRPFYGCFTGVNGVASITIEGFAGETLPATTFSGEGPCSTSFSGEALTTTTFTDPDACTCD